jgi:NADP-dependent 3-hydroxy acid dehydrogenase YdfG
MAVYAATKNAVRTITEALRQEAGDKLRRWQMTAFKEPRRIGGEAAFCRGGL